MKMIRPAARFTLSPLQPGRCADCPVRKFTPFTGVTASLLDTLETTRLDDRIILPKRNIFSEQQGTREIFTLYDGWAFTFKQLPDGRRQILDFLLPGSLIGLPALWFEAMPHSAQTLTSVSLCVFDKEKFAKLLRQKPEFEWAILKHSELRQARRDQRLTDIGRRPAKERIARLILEIFGQLTARGMADGDSFTFYPRQQHIADALGLTKVHVSRTLRVLRQEGLLEFDRDTATILDIKGLRELADYTEMGAA